MVAVRRTPSRWLAETRRHSAWQSPDDEHHARMICRLLPLLAILFFAIGCGGRSANPPPTTGTPAKTEVAPKEAPKTLAQQLDEVAPEGRPAEPAFDRVVPGMAATDIAKLIGRPDEVRERGHRATLHWRTGGPRDPVYIVWLRDGVAQRMRFSDRW